MTPEGPPSAPHPDGLAQVEIILPFTPVPITGQTFGVLLIGAAYGSKRGAATMLAYIAAGALGLPFFSGGGSGLRILTGATAGYLAGFVVAAYVIGLLCERGLERSVRTSLIPFITGTLIIYVFGVAWLSHIVGGPAKASARCGSISRRRRNQASCRLAGPPRGVETPGASRPGDDRARTRSRERALMPVRTEPTLKAIPQGDVP